MICSADLDAAAVLLQQVCEEEVRFPRSPVTPEQVTLNLDHAHRVRASAAAIALGEGLNVNLLELASILHDVCKLDHREVSSGGIDTWHHHHRGASLARKLLLVDLNLDVQVAEIIARMIESHSDIPFIRRYWETAYHSSPPTPATIEEFALRDADAMDLIWIGGMSKIIHIRQVPGSPFYAEDAGDIQRAIASARCSFVESVGVLATETGRCMAKDRILTVEKFFDFALGVKDLREFEQAYDCFVADSDAIPR